MTDDEDDGRFKMTDDAPSGEQAEALRHKRKELLRVARRHFLTEGYAAARMEAVARDASVSTATLYAFFPSKTDLFKHVIDDASDDFARQIEGVRVNGGDVPGVTAALNLVPGDHGHEEDGVLDHPHQLTRGP